MKTRITACNAQVEVLAKYVGETVTAACLDSFSHVSKRDLVAYRHTRPLYLGDLLTYFDMSK